MKNKRSSKVSRGQWHRKLGAFGASAALGALALACGSSEPPPSIVLVVADTLRADRLGYAGYEEARTPGFDALQRESVSFSQARSTSAWTLPATASLFLSQQVSDHRTAGWHDRLPDDHPGLAETLRAAGYRTGMWTANRVVSGRRGLAERFDHDELVTHPEHEAGYPLDERAFGSATSLTARALAWIREQRAHDAEAPFFAYLHYMEPHAPYLCAEPASKRCDARAHALNRRLLEMRWNLPRREQRLLSELYDADVARMDAALVELQAGLEAEGLLDRVWLVVVADHGELLGEDGLYMHGRSLREALVHVPLLFRGSGLTPAIVDTPVSIIDVAPTLLDLAGIEAPPSFQGRSLRPALEGRSLEPRPVVSELFQERAEPDPLQRHVLSVVDGTQKYLVRTDGSVERYDLARDPQERSPRAPDPGRFEALLEEAKVERIPGYYLSQPAAQPTPETLEALRNLGYLGPEGPAQ